MPCVTAVLQREQQLWVYLQALLLSASGSSHNSSIRDVCLDATGAALVLACLDGTVMASLCEGLWAPQLQPQNQLDDRGQKQQAESLQQEVPHMEERLLQAICESPFSKRMWMLLLHLHHGRRRQEGASAAVALTGGAASAEDAVLLLADALQRGLQFWGDPLAALASP
ncbi:hypothetical protein, conserved [Eimeria praecox]|uniref:Uncharacterized protein n=1 Tax=Eimeria praecox TaxID=51316 RepID=U6GQ65_9EIME|nr:hypothetical protein, conserved [Eimeria praecox]